MIDADKLQKLQDAYLMGCTDSEACLHANIVPSTLHEYQNANPEFIEQKETCRHNPILKARMVILDALNAGDLATAYKVLGEGVAQISDKYPNC